LHTTIITVFIRLQHDIFIILTFVINVPGLVSDDSKYEAYCCITLKCCVWLLTPPVLEKDARLFTINIVELCHVYLDVFRVIMVYIKMSDSFLVIRYEEYRYFDNKIIYNMYCRIISCYVDLLQGYYEWCL
jgi:hypothetical protein